MLNASNFKRAERVRLGKHFRTRTRRGHEAAIYLRTSGGREYYLHPTKGLRSYRA